MPKLNRKIQAFWTSQINSVLKFIHTLSFVATFEVLRHPTPHAVGVAHHPLAAGGTDANAAAWRSMRMPKSNHEIQISGRLKIIKCSCSSNDHTLSFVATFEEFFDTRRHTPSASRTILPLPLPAAPMPTLRRVECADAVAEVADAEEEFGVSCFFS